MRYGSDRPPRRPFGIGNSGNDCYFNSVAQSLLHHPRFAELIVEHDTLRPDQIDFISTQVSPGTAVAAMPAGIAGSSVTTTSVEPDMPNTPVTPATPETPSKSGNKRKRGDVDVGPGKCKIKDCPACLLRDILRVGWLHPRSLNETDRVTFAAKRLLRKAKFGALACSRLQLKTDKFSDPDISHIARPLGATRCPDGFQGMVRISNKVAVQDVDAKLVSV